MIADSNGDRSGDTRPLWITGLSAPNSWRPLRQPGYLQLDQVRTPKYCVWGYDRTLKMRNFRSTKVGNFQSQLTAASVRPSERAYEPQLAVEALLVVKLRVRGPILLHQGDLRAEPYHREAAIVGVEPERAPQVVTWDAAQDKWSPAGRVSGRPQRARPGHGEAPGKGCRNAELRLGPGIALAFRPLAPPAHRRVETHRRRRHPANRRQDIGERPIEIGAFLVTPFVPRGVDARRCPLVEPVPPLGADADAAKLRLVGRAKCWQTLTRKLASLALPISQRGSTWPEMVIWSKSSDAGIRGVRCRRPRAAASGPPAGTGIPRRLRPRRRYRIRPHPAPDW